MGEDVLLGENANHDHQTLLKTVIAPILTEIISFTAEG
jgi:hypothetical protein